MLLHTTVLVLAKDRFVAALLGALIKLSGRDAAFPRDGEPAALAAQRVHADLVLLDCALGSGTRASVAAATRQTGTRLLVFSAAHTQAETHDIAQQYGAEAFALPVNPREFGSHLDRALGLELPAGG